MTYEQGGADAPAAKQQIIDITAAQMKISKADATKKFDDAQAKIQQTMTEAKQKASDAADAASAGASKTSFAIFVDLLLGAIAAAAGGPRCNPTSRLRSRSACSDACRADLTPKPQLAACRSSGMVDHPATIRRRPISCGSSRSSRPSANGRSRPAEDRGSHA